MSRCGLIIGTIWEDALINVANAKAKTSRIDVSVSPEKQGSKDRLCDEIKNAVEDSLGVRSDQIATFTDAPGDGIENPDNGCKGTAHDKGSTDIRANMLSMQTSFPSENINDVCEGSATLEACQ